MADARGRSLERAAAKGDAEDRARWLREQARRGRLDEGRLRIAAWAGDPGALLALGLPRPRTGAPLVPWVDALRPAGNVALLRAAIAAARAARPALDDLPALRDHLDGAVAYAEARLEGRRAPPPRRPSGRPEGAPLAALSAADLLVQAATAPVPALMAWRGRREGEEMTGDRSVAAVVVGHAGQAVGRARVRAAVRRALLAWALGEGPP